MTLQTHSSLETPLEYNQDQSSLKSFQQIILLSDAEGKTSGLLNGGGIYFAENTTAICQKSHEPGDFITICKFGSFKNPLAMITGLSEF